MVERADDTKFGIVLPAIPDAGSAADYIRAARQVEELGFDSVFCGDHLFGTVPTYECLSILAGIAAATTRVKLGSAVVVLPLREPAITAKQVATIDHISQGRFIFGVGPGGERPEEFHAVGKAVSQRGQLTDTYLDLMKALWSGEAVDLPGWPQVNGQIGSPVPYSRPGPPIWVGGRSEAALERALRHDGWSAYATSVPSLTRTVDRLRERRHDLYLSVLVFTRIGSDADAAATQARDIIYTYYGQDWTDLLAHIAAVGDARHVRERLAAYAATGVDEVVLCPLGDSAQDLRSQLTMAADLTVVPDR